MLVDDAVALNEALVEAEEADQKRQQAVAETWANFATDLVALQTKAMQSTVLTLMGALARG